MHLLRKKYEIVVMMSEEHYGEMLELLDEIKRASATVLEKKLENIRLDQFFPIEVKVENALKIFEKDANVFYSVLVTIDGLVIATGRERDYQEGPNMIGAHGLDLFDVSVRIIEEVLKTLINMQDDESSIHLSDLVKTLTGGDLIFQNFTMTPMFGRVEGSELTNILQPFNLLLVPVETVGFLMLVLDGKMTKDQIEKIHFTLPVLIKNIQSYLGF